MFQSSVNKFALAGESIVLTMSALFHTRLSKLAMKARRSLHIGSNVANTIGDYNKYRHTMTTAANIPTYASFDSLTKNKV